MPVQEPTSVLWNAVRPHVEWPQADEEAMIRLGQTWKDAGGYDHRQHNGRVGELKDAWRDDTGQDYHAKARSLVVMTSEAAAQMTRLGWLAAQYGEDVRHAKTEIAKVIDDNAGLYASALAQSPEEGLRVVTTLVGSINAFTDAMADRVAARGALGEDFPRPEFVPSELPPAAAGPVPPGGSPVNGGDLGDLVKSGQKYDPKAEALAQRINGRAQVEFANDPKGREFDAVSDQYLAQAKPAGFQGGKAWRGQAQDTFLYAQRTGRIPYFQFDGPPHPSVLRALER